MALCNRVDPWGDLHAVAARGLFTGNRGCLVNDRSEIVRHHQSSLWICCEVAFRERRVPLVAPHRWTPVFFLDDAVALAAGHRPCGYCRRGQYESYRDGVTRSSGVTAPVTAGELNARLSGERLGQGRGLRRAPDRVLWPADMATLPVGTVIVRDDGRPCLVLEDRLLPFDFEGWGSPFRRSRTGTVSVLTPPTSVAALNHGYEPVLHPSARVRDATVS